MTNGWHAMDQTTTNKKAAEKKGRKRKSPVPAVTKSTTKAQTNHKRNRCD